jgi:hypothetical protein
MWHLPQTLLGRKSTDFPAKHFHVLSQNSHYVTGCWDTNNNLTFSIFSLPLFIFLMILPLFIAHAEPNSKGPQAA